MADTPTLPPSRALVLNVMLSLLVSAAVFVVVSQLVLVPQMARQQAEIVALKAQVDALRGHVEAENAAAAAATAPVKEAAAPAPAPSAQPASAPAAGATAQPAAAKK